MDRGRTVLVHVRGRVQGVGFRIWTKREAEALGLSGWVRNERDGSVRALFSGSGTAVAAMLEGLRQGPRGAAVDKIATEEANDYKGSDFSITG